MSNMTEDLFQKLEEKMMMLLGEVEELRNKIDYLKNENTSLKHEKEKLLVDRANHELRLKDMISLLDTVYSTENTAATTSNNLTMLVQG